MVSRKKGPVFRVTGLSVSQCDDELRTTLEATIRENLLPDEKLTLGFSTTIVPSCYDDGYTRVALVNFHDKVPLFLSELVKDPQEIVKDPQEILEDHREIWQIEMGDTDINFDCHFRGMTQLYTPKLDMPITAEYVAL
jgi:hypothetical protein